MIDDQKVLEAVKRRVEVSVGTGRSYVAYLITVTIRAGASVAICPAPVASQ